MVVTNDLCHLDGTFLLDTEGPASSLGVVAETEVGLGRAILAPVRVRLPMIAQGSAGARAPEHYFLPFLIGPLQHCWFWVQL